NGPIKSLYNQSAGPVMTTPRPSCHRGRDDYHKAHLHNIVFMPLWTPYILPPVIATRLRPVSASLSTSALH
uniref:Uncharacterized protein n=1 Tax=Gadus morhua TaxID=8049 RepID=A0A8C5AF79_GADMO